MPVFRRTIERVRKFEPGLAATVGRPDAQVHENTLWLKAAIDAAATGQALFDRAAAVAGSTSVGEAVFWNPSTSRYELATAQISANPTTGAMELADTARVRGIIASKTSTTLADILLLGKAAVDIAAGIESSAAVTDGPYYLSTSVAGKLTRNRPDLAIPVLYSYGDGSVAVAPDLIDPTTAHAHYTFELTALPAGDHTPPGVGERHVLFNEDSDLPGWLPADNAIFEGNAPALAVFGYNMSQHPALERLWPPFPLGSARIYWDKGAGDLLGGSEVPTGETGLVIIDKYGIWWTSDCYEDVPWPFNLNTITGTPSSSSESYAECAREETMRITLDMTRSALSGKTVVTSLQPHPDETRLQITDCDGNDASTGALLIRLLSELSQVDGDLLGGQAIKEYDPATNELTRGPVVMGLLAGDNITLTSALSQADADDPTKTVYYGKVTLDVPFDPAGKELPPEIVRIDDARERFAGGLTYISLPADQASGLHVRVNIPATGLDSSPSVKFRALLIGTAAGTPPAVTLTQMRVPRPSSPTAPPSSFTAVTFNVAGVGVITAGNIFEVESSAFDVAAGDTVFLTIDRAGDDGYSGELGLIRTALIIQ